MSSQQYTPQPNFIQGKITFQGRTEQLDWKKIASIDIDNLIHEGDTSQLLELIKPVTFCKADTEFDDGRVRVDPAFIKVFRISQLIAEFLLASQEKSIERLTNLQEKYNETEKEKEKLSEEILHLKETLTSAKKELKKRKEMLANTQNEILGENNGDEYDQCPYCPKKFRLPGYLLAHIQRRHQGLPANPMYPSMPAGSATVVPHHSYPETPHNLLRNRHPDQQTPGNGIYDSHFSIPMSSHHAPTSMNQGLFPLVQTPSPSILYNTNQLVPSNLSFSGSVTSLNNMPFHQNQGPQATSNNNGATGLSKRESFTQTSIPVHEKYVEQKSSSNLELLPEEIPKIHEEQVESHHSSDKHSPDSLNQLPNPFHGDSPLQVETLMRPPLPSVPSSPLPVDGSHPAADDASSNARMANTSTLRNWERAEATKVDVSRVPNQHEAHWRNLQEEKVRQNGTDEETNAMISETMQDPAGFSINSFQRHSREDGEVTKSPADVINHPQFVGDPQKWKPEFVELQKILQASVQGELRSLISRLESQEQFWQDKLASLQQDHERQIQQLRQEVQIQNGSTRNNNNRPVLTENGAELVNDNFQLEREIGDGERESIDESRGNVPPPSGIILVGPKMRHLVPQSSHQQFSPTNGATRDTLDEIADEVGGESVGIPVAKPRKSKALSGGKVTHSYSDTEHMSSAAPSPISTRVHVHQPIIQRHHYHQQQNQRPSSELQQQQQQHRHYQHEQNSRGGTLAQLQSLSESDPEFLTIIQPEEFHEGKHDNSILPNSSDASATIATTTNNKRSQQQNRRPLSACTPPTSSGLVAAMNKSGSREAEDEMAATYSATEVKSDEVSDYTLSESVDANDDEQNNDMCAVSSNKNDRQRQEQHQNHHSEFADRSRGKSSLKQAPAKKKYIFDAEARKIVEVSADEDEEEEGDEDSDNNDLNSMSSADEFEGKKRKSQLDLVRAKTIMELEQNMSDIGLNPESTAIGMEEMKRALKHFKSQQKASSTDQIQDYERLEEERNAVKTLAKFAATKSSIDERLDAISTLSSKKSQQSSFGKILTAVKSSGKNFGKRVASAVKKKHKAEPGSGEDEKSGDKKRKKKPSSAPALKTTFFSKARWTRKKKYEGNTFKKGTAGEGGKTAGEGESENSSDMSSEEESEEVEVPAFMQQSNVTNHHRHRHGSSTRSSERHASISPSRHNSARSSTRKKRSTSRPKSAKPLKRLNSNASAMNTSPPSHQPKSSAAVAYDRRNSSESPPFSGVDEYNHEDDWHEHGNMHENNGGMGDHEKAELPGTRPKSNKIQRQNPRQKEDKDFINQRRHQRSPQENTSEDDDYEDDELIRKEIIIKRAGRKESPGEDGKRRVEDLASSRSRSSGESPTPSEDWDEDEVSIATSNEILANAKSSGVISVGGNLANTVTSEGKRWNNEMSDSRLEQIKQYVNKSKKEVTRDETSLSEEGSGEEFDGRQAREEKGAKEPHFEESKQYYPYERKLAFVKNSADDLYSRKMSASSNKVLQNRTASSNNYESDDQRLQIEPLQSPASNHYGHVSQINSRTQSGPKTTFSELSTRKIFQYANNDNESERSSIDMDNVMQQTRSTKASPFGRDKSLSQSRFLTSTPIKVKASPKEQGQRDAASRQMQNSFDDMNDLDDLLNITISDDEPTVEHQLKGIGQETSSSNRNNTLDIASFSKKTSSPMIIQATNHHHISGSGMRNLKTKAEAQSKLLHDRGSPSSCNSWDSQK